MSERYTRREAVRIVGLEERRLRYWERLHLVRPQVRRGTRFYSFADLVALNTLKRLVGRQIPARRICRAVLALERQFGPCGTPFHCLRVVENGRNVAMVPPGAAAPPLDPLSRQWLLPFPEEKPAGGLHQMLSRTAEEWYEIALGCEGQPSQLAEAVEAYRHAVELAPHWPEARINLGVVLYELQQLDAAKEALRSALRLAPENAVARYNLGCILEELGEVDEAIEHLAAALRAMPRHAEAHANLALALEKKGETQSAREHWALYLRYNPNGAWASQARSCLAAPPPSKKLPPPIPFRRRRAHRRRKKPR